MKRLGLIGLGGGAVAIAAVAAVTAFGRADDSAERCFTDGGDAAISACTQAIRSGRFGGPDLAAIYDNRAIELREQGDYDRAIDDYSQAIRLDATITGAYAGRGLAYEGKALSEQARTDYRKALAVAPKYDDGEWAHDTARGRLAALGGQ